MAPQAVPATPGEWLTQPLYRRSKTPPCKTTPPTTQSPSPAKSEPSIRVRAKNWPAEYWNAIDAGDSRQQQLAISALCRSAQTIARGKSWFLRDDETWSTAVVDALLDWRVLPEPRPRPLFWKILKRRMTDEIRHASHLSLHGLDTGQAPEHASDDADGASDPLESPQLVETAKHLGLTLRSAPDPHLDVEYRQLIAQVDSTAARLLELLREGNDWKEAAERCNLKIDAAKKRVQRAVIKVDKGIAKRRLHLTWDRPPRQELFVANDQAPIWRLIYVARLVCERKYHEEQNGKPFFPGGPASPRRGVGRTVEPGEWLQIQAKMLEQDKLLEAENKCPELSTRSE